MQERRAQTIVDAPQLDHHAFAQPGIEGAQRLVQQHDAGLGDQRAGEGDALFLPAGNLRREAAAEPLQAGQLQRVGDTTVDLGSIGHRVVLAVTQTEGHVVGDAEMGE